jgi:hypothetical protein
MIRHRDYSLGFPNASGPLEYPVLRALLSEPAATSFPLLSGLGMNLATINALSVGADCGF